MSAKNARAKRRCAKKQRHPDQTAAVAHIVSMRKQGRGARLVSYPCPVCKGWHVGNRGGGRL